LPGFPDKPSSKLNKAKLFAGHFAAVALRESRDTDTRQFGADARVSDAAVVERLIRPTVCDKLAIKSP
jgi:hypothetical protein